MKVLLKSFFLVLALTILGYSAIEAGAPWMFTAQARTCCKYQVDCAESATCKTIYSECSEQKPHICVDNAEIP
jgi:hypothetical protein